VYLDRNVADVPARAGDVKASREQKQDLAACILSAAPVPPPPTHAASFRCWPVSAAAIILSQAMSQKPGWSEARSGLQAAHSAPLPSPPRFFLCTRVVLGSGETYPSLDRTASH
jgi:hypothetical protein